MSLQTELSVLQELYQESERSQEALVEEKRELEERARQLEMEERRRREEDARRVAQLEAEKTRALVAIEQRMTSESIKQQV